MFLFAQPYSIKGQFWVRGESVENQPNFKFQMGYIPIISANKKLSHDSMVDLEWAYRLDRSYNGDSLEEYHGKLYRGWLRYTTQFIEARLGLQKVSFGPARVLRQLAWFDTIDLEDPTAQTEGVEAFRFRFFPSNSLAIWTWIMKGESDTLSYGGRGELSTNIGEWGFTFHQDPSKSLQPIGQLGNSIFSPHNRLAIDFRYDGVIGLWNESALVQSDNLELDMITVGADYTLSIANGILIMSESMYISIIEKNSTSSQTLTVLMVNVPVGMGNHIMFISRLDWDENLTYNYLRWSNTYDHYSVNFILSVNPQKEDYNIPAEFLPQTLAEFGTGIQFMFIYNH